MREVPVMPSQQATSTTIVSISGKRIPSDMAQISGPQPGAGSDPSYLQTRSESPDTATSVDDKARVPAVAGDEYSREGTQAFNHEQPSGPTATGSDEAKPPRTRAPVTEGGTNGGASSGAGTKRRRAFGTSGELECGHPKHDEYARSVAGGPAVEGTRKKARGRPKAGDEGATHLMKVPKRLIQALNLPGEARLCPRCLRMTDRDVTYTRHPKYIGPREVSKQRERKKLLIDMRIA